MQSVKPAWDLSADLAATLFPILQEVFDRVFAGPEAMRCYHAECNKDQNASVGPWDGGTREIVFATKVNMPAVLTRTLGERLSAEHAKQPPCCPEGVQSWSAC